MQILHNINFNFISFGSILAASFLLFAGISLVRIKNKSRATIHIALIFLWETLHNIAYIFAFGYFSPLAAYHRWLSVAGVLPALLHMTQFFFCFPDERKVKLARVFLIVQYAIAILLTGLFVAVSLRAGPVFRSDGQFWDVNDQTIGTIISLVVLIYLLSFSGVAIWRIVIGTKEEKRKVAAMLISFLVVSLVPAVLNSLAKSGVYSREVFHTLWSLITVLGWFLAVIFYINMTSDRTSFMYKITGISFVSLLIILLTIGYFTLGDREEAYSTLHRRELPLIILDPHFRPADLQDLVKSSPENGRFSFLYKKRGVSLDHNRMKNPGQEGVRWEKDYSAFYQAFSLKTSANGTTYIAGFAYRAYRKFIHHATVRLIIILMATMTIILIGYRFFFYSTLLQPLHSLISGLRDVGEGNLAVNIPVKVEDEIGYMTGRFNRMVLLLKEYTGNLEGLVKERTNELENAMLKLNSTNDELTQTRDQLWGEMKIAKKIQTVLLPTEPRIHGYEISARMSPADEVGGDYYDILSVKNSDWIVIGDVSGHGVPAGLIMMMVQTAVQTIIRANPGLKPSTLLRVVDRAISYNVNMLSEGSYMTITALSFHPGGRIVFSGLHQDLIVYRGKTRSIERIKTHGIWLGLAIEMRVENPDNEFILDIGDILLLYTDGITEAMNQEDQMFGIDGIEDVLKETDGRSPKEIKTAILNAIDGYTISDDVTLMVIKRVL